MPEKYRKPHFQPVPQPPEGVERDHPAYLALFESYARNGKSAKRGLAAVAEYWDEEFWGIPLPHHQTVLRWAREDAWDASIDEWAVKHQADARSIVDTKLLTLAPNALDRLNDVINEPINGNPQMANAVAGAAYRLLTLAAAGILSRRFGEVEIEDGAVEGEIKSIQSMSVEEVREARRERIKNRKRGNGDHET